MKTTINKTPMLAGNVFKIADIENYDEVIVTTSEGTNAATMSFPQHKDLSDESPDVKAAIKICVDNTKDNLLYFLNSRKSEPKVEEKVEEKKCWLVRWIEEEFAYLKSMCGVK